MGVVAVLNAMWLMMEPSVERSLWSFGDLGACRERASGTYWQGC